ncbi:ATP-binding protein, partial [Streptomyces sp. 900105245]
MSRVWEVPVHDSTRVRDARMAAREACAHAGLAAERTAAAELVATELATNLLKHAGGGRMVVNPVAPPAGGAGTSVQLFSLDNGPGIADVTAALRDGYTTADVSLGAGLGSCRRIANPRPRSPRVPWASGRPGPRRRRPEHPTTAPIWV